MKAFTQRLTELFGKAEQELANAAHHEFMRLCIQDSDGLVQLSQCENCIAILAMALGWIERPKVIHRTVTDGVQLRDSTG